MNKLSQAVKELRHKTGLSQEDLASQSGLSLRTIQRVENSETEPTGETLKRISAVFVISPTELLEWEAEKDTLICTIQTKNEYLHIFNSKLIISPTPEMSDVVNEYKKSVSNVFKSLMVFFIFIPIFTALAVIFYHNGMSGLAVYSISFAVLFLAVAFYTMLFTSGAALIPLDDVMKIKIQKRLAHYVVAIHLKESGRIKVRSLRFEKNQLDTLKRDLLSENLIEEKDIKLKDRMSALIAIGTAFLTFFSLSFMHLKNGAQGSMMINGIVILCIGAVFITAMIIRLIKSVPNTRRA